MPEAVVLMRVTGAAIAGLGTAVAAVLFCGGAHADDAAPAKGPAPLIGNVTVFNDEIVEPVSLPVTTCGGLFKVLSKSSPRCDGASRVSDDDA